MNTIMHTTDTPCISRTSQVRIPHRRRAQLPGKLPPGFDPEAFVREACERSGVSFAVTDPVALSKLRVLTKPEA